MRMICLGLCLLLAGSAYAVEPLKVIFDTDMGNDVDDALTLGMLHALQDRGECELIAVTLTKEHPLCAPYVDAVNTFYGRPDIPIGVVKDGKTPGDSKFLPLAEEYPHDLKAGAAPEAVDVLRKVLAAQPDNSVAIVQVGFSTNLARLLDSGPDAHSPLTGKELAAKKVRLLSIMAGAFRPIEGQPYREYNVVEDIPAAQKLAAEWPTEIVWSGFEIGIAIPYPAASILEDYRYVTRHPLAESYQRYEPTPHERPTWDLTSVLHAVRPHRQYFNLSPTGAVTVEDDGLTTFTPSAEGKHRYLVADEMQAARVREVLAALASQPPGKK